MDLKLEESDKNIIAVSGLLKVYIIMRFLNS